MTTHYWLRVSTQFLQSKSITSARLDCLVLLEDTLKVDRAQILAEPLTEMTDPQVAHLQKLLIRRSKHEPLAYIRGRSEFYGRQFVIKPGVLTPRPESEALIDLLKGLVAEQRLPVAGAEAITIADVGAGSGALGITAALELPNCQVELLEIDKTAAEIAQINVDKFTLHISVVLSDLLEASQQDNQMLLCNLPYVPDDYPINKAAHHEPALALFGGSDGLDLYRRLFQSQKNKPRVPLFILTESLPAQHANLAALADDSGYQLTKTIDFGQLFEHLG
jgi:release factor glutamine methyltransferase